VYNRVVVFREVIRKFESKVMVQTDNNPEKVRFEFRNEEEDYSDESTESDEEVEYLTPVVMRFERVRKPIERYSPHDFHSTFSLTTTYDEPKSTREAFDSVEGKL
jgi:hypothetical protein